MLTSPKDIARIMEIDWKQFKEALLNEKHPIYKAFHKGYLLKEVELKKEMAEMPDAYTKEFADKQIRNFKAKIIIQLDEN